MKLCVVAPFESQMFQLLIFVLSSRTWTLMCNINLHVPRLSPDCPLAVPSLLPKYFLTFPSFFLHCMFIIPSRIFMLSSFDAFADFLCPPLYWLVMCGVQLCGREALGVIKDSLTVSILCVCLIDSVIINPECSVGGAWRAPFFPINEASFLTRGSSSSWYHRGQSAPEGFIFQLWDSCSVSMEILAR